jgi:hypothetical protein
MLFAMCLPEVRSLVLWRNSFHVLNIGIVTTVAGVKGTGGEVDGIATNARFTELLAVAVDTDSNLFISDGKGLRLLNSSGYRIFTCQKLPFCSLRYY